MNFSFHPQAVEELYKAVEYYENKSPGLGFEFSQEVYSKILYVLLIKIEKIQNVGEFENNYHSELDNLILLLLFCKSLNNNR